MGAASAGKLRTPLRLPTFLIIGASKTGTTTLYDALQAHPSVFMPEVKEPHFFSFMAGASPPAHEFIPAEVAAFRTVEQYATLFVPAPPSAKAIGEASTGYLCQAGAAEEIARVLPDVRLIAVVRHPVERAWSEYRMALQYGLAEGSFHDVSRAIPGILGCGMYAASLRRYLDLFPREALLVLLTDELARDPWGAVERACDHIGVERIDLEVTKVNRGRVELEMPATLRDELTALYRQDILDLQAIVGRDLSDWLRGSSGLGHRARRWLGGVRGSGPSLRR